MQTPLPKPQGIKVLICREVNSVVKVSALPHSSEGSFTMGGQPNNDLSWTYIYDNVQGHYDATLHFAYTKVGYFPMLVSYPYL